jgi:hypothetical protein
MTKQKTIKSAISNYSRLLSIAVFLSVLVAPMIFTGSTATAGQLTARSLQMSDSAPSGGTITSGVGSGTKVAYKVSFTPSANANVQGIVIDFCSNTALAGDTCTAPLGFNVNRATTVVQSGQSAGCGTGAFSTSTTDANNAAGTRIILTRTATAVTSGVCTIDIGDGLSTGNGFTNPNSNATFYARIYTYAATGTSGTAGTALGHNTNTPTGYVDFGAVALSTSSVVNVTARIQENLTFCASLAAPTANCGGTTAPAVILGHGTNAKIIDSSAVDAASAYTQISTNAYAGAIIRMHNANTCGGLSADGGTTCGVPAHNTGSGSAATAMTAGTSTSFGLSVLPGAAISGGSGSTTPDANYYSASHVTFAASNPDLYFGMDTTTSGSNTITTYGDSIMSCAGPVSNVNTQLVFAATANNTTPAGLYSSNMSLIATGTF